LRKKAPGAPWPEHDGVSIKWDPRHDPSGARVPRVIFPKGKKPVWFECMINLANDFRPFKDRYMVKNPVTECQVKRTQVRKGRKTVKFNMGVLIFRASAIQGFIGNIDPHYLGNIRQGTQVRGGRPCSTAIIENAGEGRLF